MSTTDDDGRGRHWESVYRTRPADAVSWFRPHLERSLQLLAAHGLDTTSRVIDVGGGASTLVDDLLAHGVAEVTVLDLSNAALQVAQQRLGSRAAAVDWRAGDITTVPLPAAHYSHWHDRAVLHFLHEPAELAAYAAQAARALQPGGHAVIGGFGPDGPERCSGLPVARRTPEDIARLLGPAFELRHASHEQHLTPDGKAQAFAWAVLQRR